MGSEFSYAIYIISKAESRRVEAGTIANYYKATKLFVEMNTDTPVINWKRVSRGLPQRKEGC